MSGTVRSLLSVLAVAALVTGCAHVEAPGVTHGARIRFDPTSERYAVDAEEVPRGELLDELKTLTGAEVRPQPERDALVTARATNLDLEALIALLLPPGTRATIRPGERDVAGALVETTRPKQGDPLRSDSRAATKAGVASEVAPKHTGTFKAAADVAYSPPEKSGPGTKPPASGLLRTAEAGGPKKPLAKEVPRATVRLQLEFEEGASPQLIDARVIEGRAPLQRFVTGEYLYALTAPDGRLLEAGTFQDPLVEHSYMEDGRHSEARARSGVAGISIARENLDGAVLRVLDMTGVPMPRELDERVVRDALQRGKTTLQLEAGLILRRLQEGGKR